MNKAIWSLMALVSYNNSGNSISAIISSELITRVSNVSSNILLNNKILIIRIIYNTIMAHIAIGLIKDSTFSIVTISLLARNSILILLLYIMLISSVGSNLVL